MLRAVAAIERCDVCLLMIDAQEGITEQDKKIAGIAHEAGKGIVVVVNKWDLLEKDNHTMNDFKKEIARELTFMSYAPSVFISALTGQRVDNVIAMAKYVAENRAMQHTDGAAQQSDHRCDHDEAAAFRQRKTPEDLLCDAGGRQAASLLL